MHNIGLIVNNISGHRFKDWILGNKAQMSNTESGMVDLFPVRSSTACILCLSTLFVLEIRWHCCSRVLKQATPCRNNMHAVRNFRYSAMSIKAGSSSQLSMTLTKFDRIQSVFHSFEKSFASTFTPPICISALCSRLCWPALF